MFYAGVAMCVETTGRFIIWRPQFRARYKLAAIMIFLRFFLEYSKVLNVHAPELVFFLVLSLYVLINAYSIKKQGDKITCDKGLQYQLQYNSSKPNIKKKILSCLYIIHWTNTTKHKWLAFTTWERKINSVMLCMMEMVKQFHTCINSLNYTN